MKGNTWIIDITWIISGEKLLHTQKFFIAHREFLARKISASGVGNVAIPDETEIAEIIKFMENINKLIVQR